jgi:oxalate decarboxylase/phosphoglucose isomerase-like protein (cupin superfamily)
MKTIGSCVVTRNEDVDRLEFDWGTVRMLSERGVTGAESFSFGYVELAVGQGHIRHNHPAADEVVYVLAGEGDQMLDDRPAELVTVGDCIWIPKGVYHSTINRGVEPMRLLVVYSPAGTEQALRDDPNVRVVPAGTER